MRRCPCRSCASERPHSWKSPFRTFRYVFRPRNETEEGTVELGVEDDDLGYVLVGGGG
jgi:hypothetical protein